MKDPTSKAISEITAGRVLQTTRFKNASPEFAERVAETIKKLSEIRYCCVAREMNLKHERKD